MSVSSTFDVLGYLESIGIQPRLTAHNHFAYTMCPECDVDEPKLWINVCHPAYPQGCWRCWRNEQHRGGPVKLIMHLERLDYQEARAKAERFSTAEAQVVEEERGEPVLEEIEMPKGLVAFANAGIGSQYSAPLEFLYRRGFGIRTVHSWGLRYAPLWTYEDMVYKRRLFIPVYFQQRLVAFQARDITGRQKPKYVTSPLAEDAALPLYNCDRVSPELVVLCEGVTDVWAVGREHGSCLFGKVLRPFQRDILTGVVGAKRVLVALDGDAYGDAEKIAMDLSALVPDVDLLELPYGEDPASLGHQEIWRRIGGKGV